MPNNEWFWFNVMGNQEAINQETNQIYLDAMQKELRRHQEEVIRDINSFYNRYAKNHQMTVSEAEKFLTNNEYQAFQNMNLQRFREISLNPNVPESLKEALSFRHRITRKEALLKEIEAKTIELYGGTDGLADYVYKNMSQVYQDTRIGVAKGFAEVGATFRKPVLNLNTVKTKMEMNWHNKTLLDKVWGQSERNYGAIQEVLNRGFTNGTPMEQIIEELNTKFNIAWNHAETLVKTESNVIQGIAATDQFKAQHIKYYKNKVTVDHKTSDICMSIHKKDEIHKVDEIAYGVNAPPFHARCRTIMIPHIDEKEEEKWFDDISEEEEDIIDEAFELLEQQVQDIADEMTLQMAHIEDEFDKQLKQAQGTADKLLTQAWHLEPLITDDMERIAIRNGGRLDGEDYRFKSDESLIQNLVTTSQELETDLNTVSQQIDDVLRYTTILDDATYTRDYLAMQQELLNSGYDVIRVRNNWTDGAPYKGVLAVLQKDGMNFEMQYHTQASYDLKNEVLHTLHESVRDELTPTDKKVKYLKQMQQVSDELKTPSNVERIE